VKYIKFYVSDEVHTKIKELSRRNREPMSEFAKKAIEKELDAADGEQAIDALLPIVRRAVRDIMKPTEERWAKINAKNAIQSGTAFYLLLQVLEMANVDTKEARIEARKKSVVDLKSDLYEIVDDL